MGHKSDLHKKSIDPQIAFDTFYIDIEESTAQNPRCQNVYIHVDCLLMVIKGTYIIQYRSNLITSYVCELLRFSNLGLWYRWSITLQMSENLERANYINKHSIREFAKLARKPILIAHSEIFGADVSSMIILMK